MKKNILRFMLAPFFISALAITSFLAFRPADKIAKPASMMKIKSPNACAGSCTTILTDCFGGYGCTLPGCTGVWKVPNMTVNTMTPVNSATITIWVCHVYAGTPPWTSFTQVGKMMNSWFIPPATQTFNATANNGAIFKCTIYNDGRFYMQHFSGPLPTGEAVILTGTYGIKCGSPCNS